MHGVTEPEYMHGRGKERSAAFIFKMSSIITSCTVIKYFGLNDLINLL